MTRAPALCLCLFSGASALLSACDIPPATFDDPTTSGSAGAGNSGASMSTAGGGTGASGGSGGAPNATGGSGGAPNATGGTGGVVDGPVVPCSYPMVAPCATKQVCCYDKAGPDFQDFCASPGTCNPSSDYLELQCDDNLDCPGKSCCAYYIIGADDKPKVQKTYCDDDCTTANQEVEACLESAECTFPATCKSLFIDYQTYKFCF